MIEDPWILIMNDNELDHCSEDMQCSTIQKNHDPFDATSSIFAKEGLEQLRELVLQLDNRFRYACVLASMHLSCLH
jgi:hypothetical protein